LTAFDAIAPTYDADFTDTQIGRYLRDKVHQRLLQRFRVGDHVLELGCGTGEDALFLADYGIHVTATDASAEMLNVAREKTQHQPNATVQHLDLQHPLLPDEPAPFSDESQKYLFDGVFSNFGALNCIPSWSPLALWLSNKVRRKGIVAFGIMSPYCVWELLWFGLHGDFKTALRRLRGSEFDGIPIGYPTVNRLTREFAPYFKRVSVKPLGLFLPPSNTFAVVEKRPELLQRLTTLEEKFGDVSLLSMLADHYWIEFQKK
jgi:SAM-dependent methyltransferase